MANILDIFSIGFDSKGLKDFDANLKKTRSDLNQAEKDVKALEDELEGIKKVGGEGSDTFKSVSKRLDEARENVKKFSAEIKTMEGRSDFQLNKMRQNFIKITRAVAALAIVGTTVKRSLDMYKEAEQIDYLAQKADIAVESLQRLGNAASRFGGDTESTASTIQNIQTTETKQNIINAGIKIGETPEQTLENIAAKMETLKNTADKYNLAESLGLDEGTTRLLMEGVQKYREELKRTSKYRLYTKEDIERMRDYRQVQSDIQMGVKSIQAVLARLLLPALTMMAKGLRAVTDWAAQHEGGVKIAAIFIGLAAGVATVYNAVKLLNLALTALLAHPVVATVVGIVAAVTLLIAVINDLIVFFEGGTSVIGKFFDSIGIGVQKAKDAIDSFMRKFSWLLDAFRNVGLGLPISILQGAHAYGSTSKAAREQLNMANNNPINSVPAGAVQNYNSRVASNTNNRTTNIGSITVNTQAKDGAEVAKSIQTISNSDNGLVA